MVPVVTIIEKNEMWNFSFILSMPTDIREDERLPLIFFLHGAGERGNDPKDLLRLSFPKSYLDNPPVRAIFVAPQCSGDEVWTMKIKELKCFFDHIIAEYPVDVDRVSLTGLSMGGFGTWDMAQTYPGMFSAIAPVCGSGAGWRCDPLVDMPIRVYHGDKDDIVPVSCSYEIVDRLICLGGNPELTVFHNVWHNAWDYAYRDTNLIEWLVKQNRKDRQKV